MDTFTYELLRLIAGLLVTLAVIIGSASSSPGATARCWPSPRTVGPAPLTAGQGLP